MTYDSWKLATPPEYEEDGMNEDDLKFIPDEWLYVQAKTAEDARRFFGAPPGWPVRFDRFSERENRKGRIWAVKADGLDI